MQEEENLFEESWDTKRIVVFGVIVFAIFVGILYVVHIIAFDENNHLAIHISFGRRGSVAGISTELQPAPFHFDAAHLNVRGQAQEKLDALKKEVTNLDVAEVASSSVQVQKVINDLKALQDYPKNQAKDLCQKVCSSL